MGALWKAEICGENCPGTFLDLMSVEGGGDSGVRMLAIGRSSWFEGKRHCVTDLTANF
jgi:hypothetical protein